MKQRLCCWPSPMLGDMLLFLSSNKRHALFLEAYTRRSLCDEHSSASVNSSKSADCSRCYFDLFWSAAFASAATRTLLKCSFRFQEVLIANSMQKKHQEQWLLLFIMLAYIFFLPNHGKWLLCFKVMRIKINPPKLFALHIFGHFVPWWGGVFSSLCCVGWISMKRN